MSFRSKRKFYTFADNAQSDISVRNIYISGATNTLFPDTGVTAGTYNHATVTVDAQGRITAASSGDLSGKEDKSNKNAANGYAGLSASGLIARSQLPAATSTAAGAVHGITKSATTSTHYGYQAGGGNQGNNNATTVGHSSNINEGTNSTAVGYGTLAVNGGYTDNTVFGCNAGGLVLEEGSYNTFIGSQADSADATSNYRIALGYGAQATEDHQFALPDDTTAIKMVGLAEAADGAGALLAIDSSGIIAKAPPTGVTPGSYTNASITVDAKGRLTAASTGNSGTVTSIATGAGLTGGPITTTGTVALADTAVTPGTYTNATVTVDAKGRITSASSGTGGGGGGGEGGGGIPDATTVAAGAVFGYTRSGSDSTALGYQANTASSDLSTAIGAYALSFASAGSEFNTAVGYGAGLSLTEGTNNTLIGANTSIPSGNGDYRIAIGSNAQATDDHQVAFPDDTTAIKMVGLAEAADGAGAPLAIDSSGIIAKVPALLTPGAYPISTNPAAPTYITIDAYGRIVGIGS